MASPQTGIAVKATGTRDLYVEAVRGIAIIAVIWIHSRSGADYLDGPAAGNFHYWVVQRELINFPVALFFFLAAFFVRPEKITPARPWLISRGWRFLVPFFIWSLLYGVIDIVWHGWQGSFVRFAVEVALGQTAPQLYFIVVLVQFTLLTPLLVWAARKRYGWLLFAITPLSTAFAYLYVMANGESFPRYGLMCFGWFAFYYAGVWMRVRGLPQISRPTAIGALAIAGAASIAEAYLLIDVGAPVGFAVSQLSASSILYSFTVIAVVIAFWPNEPSRNNPQWLIRLGEMSFGIYLVHMVWIFATEWVTEKVPALAGFAILPVYQVVQIALVVTLSVATILIVRRILTPKRAQALLGF